MSSIGGSDEGKAPLTSGDKKAYEEEYLHGLDLFGRALEQCTTAPSLQQQDAFKHVMARALQVLNETARGLKRGDLQEKNEKIAEDFHAYGNHRDALGERVLMEDLDQARKQV